VAADRHQAAADEGDVAGRVEQHQFAERIAQVHLGAGQAAFAARARGKRHLLDFERGAHFGKACRMARHHDQQRIRIPFAHAAVGF